MSDIIVTSDGMLQFGGLRFRCTLGKGGALPEAEKREGDGATPLGRYPLRQVFYRPDRMAAPQTRLPLQALTPQDGWCDDPLDPAYNRFVALPYAASHEKLWREDAVYDVIVVLGHNDDPPVPGLGSAIFMHVARPDYSGTEGCVALALSDLLALLAVLRPITQIDLRMG
ncbi:L,D-transpeptidase family protein [Ferrovibrio terrae]|uniref:L,D-transpeptidase family protein n=1 Tax=Ferrovibrio terrae TaxID=2594003 RepID=A0A516GX03_9PROT|nr:L,D-transpeptidase family protein [Ferrovibrio terrae]QDO95995.1 L,D-transpeptidase family protein [Ferrovibrio terrae]